MPGANETQAPATAEVKRCEQLIQANYSKPLMKNLRVRGTGMQRAGSEKAGRHHQNPPRAEEALIAARELPIHQLEGWGTGGGKDRSLLEGKNFAVLGAHPFTKFLSFPPFLSFVSEGMELQIFLSRSVLEIANFVPLGVPSLGSAPAAVYS